MALLATYPTLSQDWLKHELDPRLFRKQITIAAGTGDVITGTVLGVVTASKKFVRMNPSAADGSQNAAAILLHRTDATGTTDVSGVIVTGNAEIAPLHLTWDASVTTQAQKDAAVAQLAALGFQTRTLA